MNLHDQIKLYKPFNEQEEKDQDLILRAMVTLSDVLTRKNEILHFTSSAFVLNPSRTHVLMVYHNIYNSWSWTGGHADGEPDLFFVAKKELMEESGECSVSLQHWILSLVHKFFLFRAYYGVHSRLTRHDGTPTGAAYGFFNMIFQL